MSSRHTLFQKNSQKSYPKSSQNPPKMVPEGLPKTHRKKMSKKIPKITKKHQKTTPRKGGRKSQDDVFFSLGSPLGAQGSPRWPQGASQETFFMILGAPGRPRGPIFDVFSSILFPISRPLCAAKRGGGVGRSPLDPAHRQMPAVLKPSPGLSRVLA